MLLNIKEMELLCVFHSGTRAATVELMRHAAVESAATAEIGGEAAPIYIERAEALTRLADKLDLLPDGAHVCLAL